MKFERDIAALKLSSATILNEDGIGINREAVGFVGEQIASVNELFHPIVVLGGAVGAGRGHLAEHGLDYRDYDLQSLASYGSAAVSLALRDEMMTNHGIKVGQVLANHEQVRAGSVLMQGLVYGILNHGNVYHVNENDQENLFELELLKEEERTIRKKQTGLDNDPLAAQLTIAMIEELKAQGLDEELACHLVLFTSVGGFMLDGVVQAEISGTRKEEVYAYCDYDLDDGGRGTGGFRPKAKAGFDTAEAGAEGVYIASPRQSWVDVLRGQGEVGKVTRVVQ